MITTNNEDNKTQDYGEYIKKYCDDDDVDAKLQK